MSQQDATAHNSLVLTERIAAPPAVVFEFLVNPEKMLRWIGTDLDVEPRPGGKFWLNATGTDIASGRYLEVDPPRRVVFTWGWEGSEAVPPGSSTVTFTLSPDDDQTILELRHDGLPAGADDDHGKGWTYFLSRLVVAALDTGRPANRIDDTAITWRQFPGYEGLYFWVLGVNEQRQQVDLYFRLAPEARCPAHRHVGPTDTLVVEGVQRTWELSDGEWQVGQERQSGTFAANEGDHLHSEQGGPEGAIVHLSMTAVDGVIWETLDDDSNLDSVTTLDDFQRALSRQ